MRTVANHIFSGISTIIYQDVHSSIGSFTWLWLDPLPFGLNDYLKIYCVCHVHTCVALRESIFLHFIQLKTLIKLFILYCRYRQYWGWFNDSLAMSLERFQFGIRRAAEIENQVTYSVDRIMQYGGWLWHYAENRNPKIASIDDENSIYRYFFDTFWLSCDSFNN